MLESLGVFGLFLSSFLAATFLPFSSEAVFLYLIEKNYSLLLLLVIVATIGNTLGGMFNFYIGHLGKLEWAQKYLKIKKESMEKWELRVRMYGSYMAFFCWLPIVGDPLALALGYFRCPWKMTLLFMGIGKCLRYIFLAYIYQLST